MTHKQPLHNKRVLVTRPSHQARNQIDQLKALGAFAVPLPLLAIRPFTAPEPAFHLAKSRILDLDLYQSVIFISANAARIGAELIDDYWPQLPIRVQWLAIGKQTAATLANYGIDAETTPLGYDSEALLASPLLQQVAGQKILIVRGLGGREILAETLRARGAQVDYADLYQRTCPDYEDNEIEAALFQPLPDALLITSGEGLDNLLRLATGNHQQFRLQPLLTRTLVVPSHRIAERAAQAGFTRIRTAAGPDDQAMIEALLAATDADID